MDMAMKSNHDELLAIGAIVEDVQVGTRTRTWLLLLVFCFLFCLFAVYFG
jgi:hypothetical protein